MNRFSLLIPSHLALLALCLICQSAAVADRPNIVLIMADDMGFECVAANGGETYQTPHLDQLAATGMRFEHCYGQPICTPSRVQIMTGRYNSQNYIKFGLLDPNARTFGNVLRDAGYKTCIVGKWQLSGGFQGPGKFGFDEYCLWQLTRRPNRYPNPGLEINGKEVDYKNGEYGPDIVSDYACDFMDRHASDTTPFFLYYPMMLPHWPFEPTPDSPDWDPEFRRGDQKEKSYGMRKHKHFIEMVAYADKMVGKLVAKMESLAIRDNTLLIFTCDNGTAEGVTSRFKGRDWKGGKGHMMDSGTHVPMIANWPGRIAPGKVNENLVDFSDMLPTLADVADVQFKSDSQVTGISFYPQLLGQPGSIRDHVYCWYYRNGKIVDGGKDRSAGESARNRQYKLYHSGEFYDVTADFDEKSPLVIDTLNPQQQSIRESLRATIEKHKRKD